MYPIVLLHLRRLNGRGRVLEKAQIMGKRLLNRLGGKSGGHTCGTLKKIWKCGVDSMLKSADRELLCQLWYQWSSICEIDTCHGKIWKFGSRRNLAASPKVYKEKGKTYRSLREKGRSEAPFLARLEKLMRT